MCLLVYYCCSVFCFRFGFLGLFVFIGICILAGFTVIYPCSFLVYLILIMVVLFVGVYVGMFCGVFGCSGLCTLLRFFVGFDAVPSVRVIGLFARLWCFLFNCLLGGLASFVCALLVMLLMRGLSGGFRCLRALNCLRFVCNLCFCLCRGGLLL